jgi:hypothetical protein
MATSCLAQQRGVFHTETNETTFMIHHARDVPPSRVQARGVETGGGSMMAVIDFIQGLIWLGVAVSLYMLPAYVASADIWRTAGRSRRSISFLAGR